MVWDPTDLLSFLKRKITRIQVSEDRLTDVRVGISISLFYRAHGRKEIRVALGFTIVHSLLGNSKPALF